MRKAYLKCIMTTTEPVKKIVPHRVLALNRGEKEDILKINLLAPVDRIIKCHAR